MRVCILSPDPISDRNGRSVADRIQRSAAEKVEVIYLTNYPWAKDSPELENPHVMAGCEALKMRICRKFLQVMSHATWNPTPFGYFAVRLCEKEIIEGLLACDPDVIFCSDAGWAKQLTQLLRKRHFPWLCVTQQDSLLFMGREWKKYDPSVKVSIILPTYNGSKYIRRSIESCLSQTHENLELLVVDDGSNELCRKILESYEDNRLTILRHEQNQGVAAALNTGFRNSSGKYLTWTSDDNYYAPSAIETMIRFLQTYRWVDFVYAESYLIGEDDQVQPQEIWRTAPPDRLKVDNPVGACFLYKRNVYEAIGDYKSEMFLVEDYDYWVRVSKAFTMQRLFRPLYYYRRHAESLTMKHGREEVLEKVSLVKQVNKLGA